MEMLRHAGAVVDRIIVPQERLAAQLLGDAGEMAGGEFPRADLGPCPEDADRGIEGTPQLCEIERRPRPERDATDILV